jgi:SAM-dependent methyltransferase
MRFSVFTPSHDTRYLAETYASLVAQTFTDWEWVIVLNHGATLNHAMDDLRVRVFTAPADVEATSVGALKRYACQACEGEYLVELDHDDLLLPHALQKIDESARAGAEFIYSDTADFRSDGEYRLFGKEWGWKHYSQRHNDKVHQVNGSFELTASALRAIFYAPNHVRVWQRALYQKIGGHDVTLKVCDDFDLICRTYLAGAVIHHIEECLYLYRLQEDGGNTWLLRNADIQAKQQEVADQYRQLAVHEWCRRAELQKLDLGGGSGCPEGYLAADLKNGVNLRRPWPFADNSMGIVRAYDFLEHVPHCRDSTCTHQPPFCVVGLMNEIHRVLAPGGWLLTATPSTDGRGAFQDPTHCSFWNPNSWWYYTRAQQQQFVPGIKARFQNVRMYQTHPSEWHKLHEILYVYADLIALKGQREPGLIEI